MSELGRRNGMWVMEDDATALQNGDEVVASGPLAAQVRVREAVGPQLPDAEARALVPLHTVDVVIGVVGYFFTRFA